MSDIPYAEEFDEDDDYNPFQAPQSSLGGGDFAGSHVEAIRRQHLAHEASVKSIGTLYLLGGGLMTIISIVMLVLLFGGPQPIRMGRGDPPQAVFLLVLALGVLQIATAVGLRSLRPWSRVVSGILSAIGLIGFPLGTLISAYILYLLFSPKGTMVFSEEYKSVIEQTPHIVYKTSIIVWIFLFLLLGLILLGIVGILMTG